MLENSIFFVQVGGIQKFLFYLQFWYQGFIHFKLTASYSFGFIELRILLLLN